MNEIAISKYEKIREKVSVLLVFLWLIIPILKNIKGIWIQVMKYEYTFIKIAGAIGLIFLIIDIIKNIIQKQNRKKYFKEILPILVFSIFMIWTFICCLFSDNMENAFLGNSYRKEGYITYLAYAGFFSCAFFVKSKLSKKILINVFVVVAVIDIFMIVLGNIGVLEIIIQKKNIKTAGFYQFNHYGYYLLLSTVTTMFLFVTEKEKIVKLPYLMTYAFLLYNLILNDTFGCYLALVATIILFFIYCLFRKKYRIVCILVIIIFALVSISNQKTQEITRNNIDTLVQDVKNIITLSKEKKIEVTDKNNENDIQSDKGKAETRIEALVNSAGTGRVKLWKNGIKFFLDRPILGYGPDNLEVKYRALNIKQDRPHNLLIQLATTSGIIGVTSYVIAIGIILIRGLKTIKMDNELHVIIFFVVVTYLISAMFANSMYYISPYFFIFLGFLMRENINSSDNK